MEKLKLKFIDYIVIALMVIPWDIHSGSTYIEETNTSIDLTIIQFWLFRITSSDSGNTLELFGGRGDALYIFFFSISSFLFLYVVLLRLWRAITYFISDKKLIEIYLWARKLTFSGEETEVDIYRERHKGSIGAAFFFALVNILLANFVSLRDILQSSYNLDGVTWGRIDNVTTPWIYYLIPSSTHLSYLLPVATFVFFIGILSEFRKDKFAFVNSTGNFIRFGIIWMFIIISIFPLIWVLIVSVNEQRTIQAGFPLWPLDPSRRLDFDSYKRFFFFSGSWIAWIYFVLSGILGILMYSQLNHSGKWLDKIQEFNYERVSKKLASNKNTSILFLSMLLGELVLFLILISMIVAEDRFLGLPPGKFSWTLIDSTGTERHIGNWFIVTTIICTGVSVYGLVMACLSAYSLSRFNFPAKKTFISVVLGTQMFPGIILLLPLLVMWNELQLTNSIFGLTVAYATFAVPFSTFMMKGYFDSIPKDLEEAAMVDGSTQLGAFTRVILPISLPGLASTFLFSFLTGYTEYLLALTLYQAPEPQYTISLALINVFRTDLQYYYYPDLALFSIIVALPILLMFVYLQRFLIAGLASGGIKG